MVATHINGPAPASVQASTFVQLLEPELPCIPRHKNHSPLEPRATRVAVQKACPSGPSPPQASPPHCSNSHAAARGANQACRLTSFGSPAPGGGIWTRGRPLLCTSRPPEGRSTSASPS
ncbi:signal transducer and activator of transcription2 [Striga asiatica]|uniref:Signal transducer and activator of transcription2 n=1 Tax=Striga asiatica TaxID=4170 RepID=A0A5A7R0H7_STRAF|nr:signal transducer and activator of transcription2 [Striga asiatica]